MQPTAGQLVTPSIQLVRPLGAGGMGAVWLADHLALRTQVVVKFIAEALASSPEALGRFTREAAAASQVKSPHVVQTLDHGVTAAGLPFIVMELLEGHDLSQELETRGKLAPAQVAVVVTQLSRALSRAHERGIVHRDLKPANVFLSDAGGGELFVKLLDFGIAKGGAIPELGSGTRTGSMVGSPYYMSPEQIVGDKGVDYKSDLWSLGVLAYEALTGVKPFDADTVGGLALKIHNEPLPRPTALNPELPPAIDAWFDRACARDPKGRFSGAKEMADAFTAALSGQAPSPSLVPASIPQPSPSKREIEFAATEVGAASALTGDGIASTSPGRRSGGATLFIVGAVAAVTIVGVAAYALGSRPAANAVAPATSSSVDHVVRDLPAAARDASALPSIVALPIVAAPEAGVVLAPLPSANRVKPTARPAATNAGTDDDIK